MSVLSVAITVIDIEDENDPVFTSSDTASFDENGTGIVYTAVATDASTVTYSLSGMIDDDLFTVGSNSGDLTFIDTPDFENVLDSDADNVYEITITATDASGNTAHLVIAITVNDLDENAPVFTSSSTVSFEENGTGVVYTATDESTVNYSLTGSIDDALFIIEMNTGQLNFNTAPDFESPLDDGTDNVYDIEITATDDAENTSSLAVAITVNEEPLSVIRNKDISVDHYVVDGSQICLC